MKKLLLTAAMIVAATAASAKTVYYPEKHCAEIVSSEYSTGGGDSAFEMFEVLCKSADGKYTAFVTSWASVAGFFGMGRIAHEEVINLVPYDGETLKAD